ncbi:MAG: alpha/beta hydrolase [Thermoguttaceae bacterium]
MSREPPDPRPAPSCRPARGRLHSWCAGLWRVFRLWLIAYLLVVLGMMFFEESLIFLPSDSASGDWNPRGLPVEDAWFQAGDGTKLHGWYLRHERPRAVILFCHGNAGNVTDRADVADALQRRVGASVLVFDYRGYGKSEGRPTEAGVLADARAARAWLARRENISEDRIVVMGESIGGAIAVDLAADGARALVLENTFSSLPEVAARHLPWLPVRLLMRTRLDARAKIAEYHGPLLQSHGDCDSLVPIELGRRLFEAAGEPKRFIVYRGLDHNDGRPTDYYATLAEFLDGCP